MPETVPAAFISTPLTPVSWGEIIDKIAILEIKADKITAPAALANVTRELELLREATRRLAPEQQAGIAEPAAELKQVNLALWDVEDSLREHEKKQTFGASFVELARSVYRLNDKRSDLKKTINLFLRSEIVEEKSYHQ